MKKQTILITVGIIVIGGIVGTLLFMRGSNSELTDAQIKQKFACDRKTLELRNTDVYCQDPNLYRQHVKENRVIKYQ